MKWPSSDRPDEPPEPTERLPPGLYSIGTPIGNLGDISLRALETLRAADGVLAEDTRITRRLLARYTIRAPVWSCHRFNEQSRAEDVIRRIRSGQAVALATDSGMPGVSDPGARITAACREAGIPVTTTPGPSAVTAAMALCGFEAPGFRFAGFLPKKRGAVQRTLDSFAEERDPVVFFESPYRLLKLLDLLDACLPERRLFIGRELTKRFEETRVGTAAELKAIFEGRAPRGECVLVLEPYPRRRGASQDARPRKPPAED